jgi:hypothetical protein
MICFFPFSMVLAVGLSYISFIILTYIPSISSFLRAFMMKHVEFCQRIFLHWDNHVIFVLDSTYVLYYICWFVWGELCLHSWIEANLIMVYDIFNVLQNLVCKYFIDNICIYVHHRNWSIIFCYVIVRWWFLGNTGMSLVAFLPFLCYRIILGALVIVVIEKSGRIQQWIHPGLGCSLFGDSVLLLQCCYLL